MFLNLEVISQRTAGIAYFLAFEFRIFDPAKGVFGDTAPDLRLLLLRNSGFSGCGPYRLFFRDCLPLQFK